MKNCFFRCLALVVCVACLTACSATPATPTAADPTSATTAPEVVESTGWNTYARIEAVKTDTGFLLLWPDAKDAVSYLAQVDKGEAVTVSGNTFSVSTAEEDTPSAVTVKAIDETGMELDMLTWQVESSTPDKADQEWTELYAGAADDVLQFISNNDGTVNKLINVDIASYNRVKVSYDAAVSSYSTGPAHYTGLKDCATVGIKICMGDTRVLVTTEKDHIYGGVADATWGNSVPYKAGSEWHNYEIILDKAKNTYEVYIDGQLTMSGAQSARTIIANNVEFFAMGTSNSPVDSQIKNISIACVSDEAAPIWNYTSKIHWVSHTDGFTLAWPSAKFAEHYLVQIGDTNPVKVEDNCYTATGLAHTTNGYDVKIMAVGKNGAPAMIQENCNTKFAGGNDMDLRVVLAGNMGGANDTKYALYRIPGLIVTEKNTLIMFYEARVVPSDNGGMDIIAFRSTDGGETFSEPIMLAEGASRGQTMNNATMIVDGGTIHLLYCVNYGVCNVCANAAYASCAEHGGGGVYYRKSTDDGITWSEPVNISDSTIPNERYLFAVGPGTGLCMDDGTLIAPVWLVLKSKGDPTDPLKQSPGDIAPLYSKDGGATWLVGDVLKTEPSTTTRLEPLPVKLSDGRIMYNIRVYNGWRAVAVSDDGINDFSMVKFDKELIDPFCNAGFTAYNGEGKPYTLFFVNCEYNDALDIGARKNLVLKSSTDDGETWTKRMLIDPGKAGYSSVAVDQNGIVYVLYEADIGKQVKLARFTYDYFMTNAEDIG